MLDVNQLELHEFTWSLQLQYTKLTLVRLIAVVGETVGTAVANPSQLTSLTTGRVALSSWHWSPNVRMIDREGIARFFRGTS